MLNTELDNGDLLQNLQHIANMSSRCTSAECKVATVSLCIMERAGLFMTTYSDITSLGEIDSGLNYATDVTNLDNAFEFKSRKAYETRRDKWKKSLVVPPSSIFHTANRTCTVIGEPTVLTSLHSIPTSSTTVGSQVRLPMLHMVSLAEANIMAQSIIDKYTLNK